MSGSKATERPGKGPEPRRYRGMTAVERSAQRQEQLLEAGLEVFGTVGYAQSSVREISRCANLNSRYFYESFPDREALLIAVYERIIFELAQQVGRATAACATVAEQAMAGLAVTWDYLTSDRRRAKVLALEVVGVSDRLERLRRAYRHGFAEILVQNAIAVVGAEKQTRLDPVLVARALIGGLIDVLVDWLNGDLELSSEEIVRQFGELYTAAAAAAVGETPAQLRRRQRRGELQPVALDVQRARSEAGFKGRPG